MKITPELVAQLNKEAFEKDLCEFLSKYDLEVQLEFDYGQIYGFSDNGEVLVYFENLWDQYKDCFFLMPESEYIKQAQEYLTDEEGFDFRGDVLTLDQLKGCFASLHDYDDYEDANSY
jgi:hypothetical protein